MSFSIVLKVSGHEENDSKNFLKKIMTLKEAIINAINPKLCECALIAEYNDTYNIYISVKICVT